MEEQRRGQRRKQKNIERIKEFVAGLTKEDSVRYFALAKSTVWARVLEAGEQATDEQLSRLRFEIAWSSYGRKGGPLVPKYALNDDDVLLCFMAELTEKFFDLKQ